MFYYKKQLHEQEKGEEREENLLPNGILNPY